MVEPNSYYSINTIVESRDVLFDESRFNSIPKTIAIENEQPKNPTTKVEVDEPNLRRSKRGRTAKTYGPDFHMYLICRRN